MQKLTETRTAQQEVSSKSFRLEAVPGQAALALRLGHSSRAVDQKHNEDYYGIVTPDLEPDATTRGIALAVADGSSGIGAGRLASETAHV